MIPTPTPLAGETTEGEAGCEDFFSSLLVALPRTGVFRAVGAMLGRPRIVASHFFRRIFNSGR